MIVKCWGEIDDERIDFQPMHDRPGYWCGYCSWRPGLLHLNIWAENQYGAVGHVDCDIQVQYDNASTKCRLILYPYKIDLYFENKFLGDVRMKSITFDFGEQKNVTLDIRSLDRKAFYISEASWELHSSDEIESQGDAKIIPINSTHSQIECLIEPLKPDSLYDLKVQYKINDKILIEHVRVRTEL